MNDFRAKKERCTLPLAYAWGNSGGMRNVEPLSISRDLFLLYETISRHLSRSKLDFASIHKIRRIPTVSSHFLLDFAICFFPKRTDEMLAYPAIRVPFATICHRSRFRYLGRLKIRRLQGGYFYLISLYLCRTSPTRGKSDTRKVLNLAGLSIFLGNLSIETK
jgi:hypothetical protein